VTEFKYLSGQQSDKTTIVYEFPQDEGDPYYPVPRRENAELYKQYSELAAEVQNVYFCGRLATYKYYNMDQVVAQALTLFNKIAASETEIVLPSGTTVTTGSRIVERDGATFPDRDKAAVLLDGPKKRENGKSNGAASRPKDNKSNGAANGDGHHRRFERVN